MDIDNGLSEDWYLTYDHYDAEDEGRREALLALGNGYLVSRAAAPEATDDEIHYPGTYRVGCYNRLKSRIKGQEVENESLVNLPNWLSLTFRIQQGNWFSLDEVEILSYRQVLNIKNSVLHRYVHFRDEQGRLTRLSERRFVSMAQPHLMCLEVELTAENWSGELEIQSGIDGRVANNNVRRYKPYNNQHLQVLNTERVGEEGIALQARTRQSGVEIALAARTRIRITGSSASVVRHTELLTEQAADSLRMTVATGQQLVVEKIAVLYTSQDFGISGCRQAATHALSRMKNFDTLLSAHCKAWKQIWQRCHLSLGDTTQLNLFRLHIFHILQNISPHTADMDVGVPPSGWQGEEYHGQIFWDELFVFPFLAFRFPAVARSLLLYRYRRLDEACHLAKRHGYRGAMFPWRSGSTGKEETPRFQYNLLSGHWLPDHTCLQRHIGAVIAYNVRQYVLITGDHLFMQEYGAELFLEIARFWASAAHYVAEKDRYEIHGVVGPDEYHTQYSGAATPGINNNTYTNVMAVWTLSQAQQVFERLSLQRQQELMEALSLSQDELHAWDTISRKMYISFHEDGILSQFEGFEELQKFDLRQFREQYGDQRIDWTLEKKGDAVERYQIAKQADTALLLYLFSPSELTALLKRLGYFVDRESLRRTVKYHLHRTAHESSLSHFVYAGALSTLEPEISWDFFQQAMYIDLLPEEDKDAAEGIHLGAMGATLGILHHHFLGIRIQNDLLVFEPALPKALDKVEITLYYQGTALTCHATNRVVRIRSVEKQGAALTLGIRGNIKKIEPGATVVFNIA